MELSFREAYKQEIDSLKKLDNERKSFLFDIVKEHYAINKLEKKQSGSNLLDPWDLALISKREKNGFYCGVAIEDEKIIGFILSRCSNYSHDENIPYNKKGHIIKVYVKDQIKNDRKNVYIKLIQKASDWIVKEGGEFIEYSSTPLEFEKYLCPHFNNDDIFKVRMIHKINSLELEGNNYQYSDSIKIRMIEENYNNEKDIKELAGLSTMFFNNMENLQPNYIKSSRITLEQIQNNLESKEIYLIIELNDKIVGYARLKKVDKLDYTDFFLSNSSIGQIKEIFTLKEYRGSGLGKRLVKEIKKWGYQNDCSILELQVHGNNTVQKLYFNEGFSEIEFIYRLNS